MSEHDFQKAADHTLEELANSFDALLEGNDIEGSDLEYGVSVQNSAWRTPLHCSEG